MSSHKGTLSWFQAYLPLLFLLIAPCLTEKQQIPILYYLVWPDRGWNSWSTSLEASTPTITPPMRWNIAPDEWGVFFYLKKHLVCWVVFWIVISWRFQCERQGKKLTFNCLYFLRQNHLDRGDVDNISHQHLDINDINGLSERTE